jgi:hypothetical protein
MKRTILALGAMILSANLLLMGCDQTDRGAGNNPQNPGAAGPGGPTNPDRPEKTQNR